MVTGAGGQVGAEVAACLSSPRRDRSRPPVLRPRRPRFGRAGGGRRRPGGRRQLRRLDRRRRLRGRPRAGGARQRPRGAAPGRRLRPGRCPPRARLHRLRLLRRQGRALRRVGRARSPVRLRPLQARRRAGGLPPRRIMGHRPHVVGLRPPGSQLRRHDRRAGPGRGRRCGSSTTSGAVRPTPPTWPGRWPGWRWNAARACTTSPTRGPAPGTTSPPPPSSWPGSTRRWSARPPPTNWAGPPPGRPTACCPERPGRRPGCSRCGRGGRPWPSVSHRAERRDSPASLLVRPADGSLTCASG